MLINCIKALNCWDFVAVFTSMLHDFPQYQLALVTLYFFFLLWRLVLLFLPFPTRKDLLFNLFLLYLTSYHWTRHFLIKLHFFIPHLPFYHWTIVPLLLPHAFFYNIETFTGLDLFVLLNTFLFFTKPLMTGQDVFWLRVRFFGIIPIRINDPRSGRSKSIKQTNKQTKTSKKKKTL